MAPQVQVAARGGVLLAALLAAAACVPGGSNAEALLEAQLLREAYTPEFQEWLIGHRRWVASGATSRQSIDSHHHTPG
jgi:hypothetical protein